MRALRFVKFDPGGNLTAIILDAVPRGQMPSIAAQAMQPSALHVEQVGFLEAPVDARAAGRLRMMGGEFCGNAARCLAAWLVLNDEAAHADVTLEVSGHSGLLHAVVDKEGNESLCRVRVDMPRPLFAVHGMDDRCGAYSLVAFEGISHAVLWEKEAAEDYIAPARMLLCDSGLDTACFGVLFTNSNDGQPYMTPYVYVDDTGTGVWESSCGSGTVAVAAAHALRSGEGHVDITLWQPGGALRAEVRAHEQEIQSAYLFGEVRLMAKGEVYIA